MAMKPSAKPERTPEFSCHFCGKPEGQVARIIFGPGVFICDECVDLCVEILQESGVALSSLSGPKVISVQELGLNPVFTRLEISPRANHCFYLGPFSDPFNEIYRDHVVPTLNSLDVSVERADEIFSTDALIEDIWASIVSSTFVVADLTTRNANVLYEVGIAHTVGKPVAIITQDIDDVPFDLRHRRCIVYQHTPRGCQELERQLAGTAAFILKAGIDS